MNFNPGLNNLNLIRVQTLKKKEGEEKVEKGAGDKFTSSSSPVALPVEASALDVLASNNRGTINVKAGQNVNAPKGETFAPDWVARYEEYQNLKDRLGYNMSLEERSDLLQDLLSSINVLILYIENDPNASLLENYKEELFQDYLMFREEHNSMLANLPQPQDEIAETSISEMGLTNYINSFTRIINNNILGSTINPILDEMFEPMEKVEFWQNRLDACSSAITTLDAWLQYLQELPLDSEIYDLLEDLNILKNEMICDAQGATANLNEAKQEAGLMVHSSQLKKATKLNSNNNLVS